MAEVINFTQKVKELKETKLHEEADDDADIANAKVIAKETFFETMLLLEDLGYDVNEDPKMLKDLEALSFLAAAIIFRAHGNDHPGTELLEESYRVLLKVTNLLDELEPSNINAKTDNPL
jgi:hypothetical protein